MKTVYLIRHAKSDWGNEHLRDIDRPLNQRGYSDAYLQSKLFAKEHQHPELLVTSPAVRAYSTCAIFAREINYNENKIQIVLDLYEASTATIISTLATINNKINSVALFGHNPGFTNVFDEISDAYVDEIPTCGIVGVKFRMHDWSEVYTTKGESFLSFFPKNFKQ